MKLRKIFYTTIGTILLTALSTCIYPNLSKLRTYAAEYSDNWKLNSDNNWEYYKNGNKLKNTWLQDNNNWYLLDMHGVMGVGLYESFGKYYLLDDVRGTGTYGKLLKNGGTYKGINISADTSSEYEGALSEATLNQLSGVGLNRSTAKGLLRSIATHVAGTEDNTSNGAVQSQGKGGIWDTSQYQGDGKNPVEILSNREGGNILTGIYEDGRYYCIGNDGKKYKRHPFSTTARYFPYAEDFLASDWAKYLDTGKVAPDGGIYSRGNIFSERVIFWHDTYETDFLVGGESITIYYKSEGATISDKYKDY